MVSKTIDLTDATDATLTYWTYWSTESWANYDQKLVEVSVNGGAWTLLEQLPAGTGEGTRTIVLPVGNPIKIRFYFNTGDNYRSSRTQLTDHHAVSLNIHLFQWINRETD